jgi:hypothetical protein
MSVYMLSLLSVVLFCLSARQFLKAVLAPIPVYNNTEYGKTALRVAKFYKTLSWATMCGCFMVALVISFYQVFTEI